MLQLGSSMPHRPILSLRTGRPVANVTAPIFNPSNLKIEGFYCLDSVDKTLLVLLQQDIREVFKDGFVVNDHDTLADPADLVRLKDLMELNYELLGKPVQTVSHQKLGKVSDYAVEMDSLFIQKIYVAQSILKSFTGGNLGVDRSQINEVTNRRIIINDLLDKARVPATATA